jgi:hypothetical protein
LRGDGATDHFAVLMGHNLFLDWALVLGRRHLERVLGTYVRHYNEGRRRVRMGYSRVESGVLAPFTLL